MHPIASHFLRPAGVVLTLALFLPVQNAWSDIVHLQDGGTLEGDVKKAPDGWTVNTLTGAVSLKAEDVKSIEVGKSALQSDDADLASLRRSVASADDAQQVVDKYKRFIASAKGPAAEAAKADLLIWQDRLDRGLVRFAGKWVTPKQAQDGKAKLIGQIGDARALVMQGQAKDAKSLLEQILSADPQNPAALYLKGVVAFSDGDIPLARKSFDAANSALPADGPTLNNLAVVMMRQNQTAGALKTYERALAVSPLDSRILDNVAEALHSASEDTKLATAVKKTAAVFSPLDQALAKRLADEGWYRWGATWVPQAQLEQLMAAEKKINDQIAEYEHDFKAAQDSQRQIDSDIAANTRSMQRIEANSVFRDEKGRLVQTAYPAIYFKMQDDNKDLKARRQEIDNHIAQMRAAAKDLKAQLPTPRYTGAQRLIGPENTPGLPPVSDTATAPVTPPTSQAASAPPATSQPATTTELTVYPTGKIAPPNLPVDLPQSSPPPRSQMP
jgi:Tfp pilus assembly protein PilF